MKRIKTRLTLVAMVFCALMSCSDDNNDDKGQNGGGIVVPDNNVPMRNAARSIEMIDNAVDCYFTGDNMKLYRYYNPYTGNRTTEVGSVWMYTSSIEAVNAAMKAMKAGQAKGETTLYDTYFEKYKELLAKLYDNIEYYAGTFTLTSYTQTKKWTVYGVNRADEKGTADVDGVNNVYDDQMWLIRELLESYKNTGEQKYLEKAEYLVSYVLDGWDCSLDSDGNQRGGITWGPGYVTKHSCSNGPIVSSLVWLHDIYKDKTDNITYGYIDADHSRKQRTEKKADYYLSFAKAVYDWQKKHLLNPNGLYDDMMGGYDSPDIQYEEINGVKYRTGSNLKDRVGPEYSYNTGAMISGAADLYRATGDAAYKNDLTDLTAKSFAYFAKADAARPGCYAFDITGFNNWFNGVLMRGYADAYSANAAAATPLEAFQNNLDYSWNNYMYKNVLPTNILEGWFKAERSKNNVDCMSTFSFAAEYALLANYEWSKK